MGERRYEVEVRGYVTVVIDDEAVSDYDGKKITEIHDSGPDRWADPASMTPDRVIGFLAVQNGIYGSRDGLADFDRDAIRTYVQDFEPEYVRSL